MVLFLDAVEYFAGALMEGSREEGAVTVQHVFYARFQ